MFINTVVNDGSLTPRLSNNVCADSSDQLGVDEALDSLLELVLHQRLMI